MNILVCIKQVPGTTQVEVDPQTGVLKRDGVESKMNPYDLYALELALQLTARYGGDVKVITMGPPQAKAVIAEAVFMGASNGTVVSDRCFAGADVLATSYTLSQGITAMGKFDLIICGKQTTDGDTAQVGAEVAEFLGLPHVSNVLEVEDVTSDSITVKVNLDRTIVREKMPRPCLICSDGGINSPRLPSYKRKRLFSEVPMSTISLCHLVDQNDCNYGLTGSPTQVERIFPPDKNTEKLMLSGSNAELAQGLYGLLKERKFI